MRDTRGKLIGLSALSYFWMIGHSDAEKLNELHRGAKRVVDAMNDAAHLLLTTLPIEQKNVNEILPICA